MAFFKKNNTSSIYATNDDNENKGQSPKQYKLKRHSDHINKFDNNDNFTKLVDNPDSMEFDIGNHMHHPRYQKQVDNLMQAIANCGISSEYTYRIIDYIDTHYSRAKDGNTDDKSEFRDLIDSDSILLEIILILPPRLINITKMNDFYSKKARANNKSKTIIQSLFDDNNPGAIWQLRRLCGQYNHNTNEHEIIKNMYNTFINDENTELNGLNEIVLEKSILFKYIELVIARIMPVYTNNEIVRQLLYYKAVTLLNFAIILLAQSDPLVKGDKYIYTAHWHDIIIRYKEPSALSRMMNYMAQSKNMYIPKYIHLTKTSRSYTMHEVFEKQLQIICAEISLFIGDIHHNFS